MFERVLCMCACLYVCMYVCVHVCFYVCMYVCCSVCLIYNIAYNVCGVYYIGSLGVPILYTTHVYFVLLTPYTFMYAHTL